MLVTPYIFGVGSSVFWKAPYFTLCLEVTICVLAIGLVVFLKKRNRELTQEDKDEIIEKFTPDSLVPDVLPSHPALSEKIVTGKVAKRITINGHDCINFGTHNYQGLLGDPEIQKNAITSLRKYGVGSCGPRGFYGTIDVHLELEERLAKFMNCEEAVVYSYAFSTVASAIPAYAKRKDIIFVDEEVHFAIQKGLDASRSKIVYFKHNDMTDLENLLIKQEKLEQKNPKILVKKFIVVEGVYVNTGEMCQLDDIVRLREKYKLRLFLDESISFGTVGKSGRGVTEYFNIPRDQVDLISSSLEHAVGSIGGFCVGTTFIIEHQRLSGLGYCFSASLPPLLTQAAICALDKFETNPAMFKELQDVSENVQIKMVHLSHFTLRGHPISPIKHLYLKNELTFDSEYLILNEIVEKCLESKLAITVSSYLDSKENLTRRNSIRLTTCRLLTHEDIEFACKTIEKSAISILGDV